MRKVTTKPKRSLDELREQAEANAFHVAKTLKRDLKKVWHGRDDLYNRPCFVVCEDTEADTAVIIYDNEPGSMFSIIKAKQRLHAPEVQQ